jgi:hypothetical protein
VTLKNRRPEWSQLEMLKLHQANLPGLPPPEAVTVVERAYNYPPAWDLDIPIDEMTDLAPGAALFLQAEQPLMDLRDTVTACTRPGSAFQKTFESIHTRPAFNPRDMTDSPGNEMRRVLSTAYGDAYGPGTFRVNDIVAFLPPVASMPYYPTMRAMYGSEFRLARVTHVYEEDEKAAKIENERARGVEDYVPPDFMVSKTAVLNALIPLYCT